jgi:hypothetical protein
MHFSIIGMRFAAVDILEQDTAHNLSFYKLQSLSDRSLNMFSGCCSISVCLVAKRHPITKPELLL